MEKKEGKTFLNTSLHNMKLSKTKSSTIIIIQHNITVDKKKCRSFCEDFTNLTSYKLFLAFFV